MISISANDLINMNIKANTYNFRVDLAYARNDNLLFDERIYRQDAQLWLHRDLADIVYHAAQMCWTQHQLRFILYDGLRTIEAQEAMMQTSRVKDNPHWLEPPRLLSPAGSGGHPRGMAIDIGLETQDGSLIDMGCPFDYLAENPHPDHNPAHRNYKHSLEILNNRKILDGHMINAAKSVNTSLRLLPEEWWDFRLPADIYNKFSPLCEKSVPANMRLL